GSVVLGACPQRDGGVGESMVACKGSYSLVPARETTWPLRSWSVPTIGSYRRTATESWDPPSTRKMPSRSRLPLRGRDWRDSRAEPSSAHGWTDSTRVRAAVWSGPDGRDQRGR